VHLSELGFPILGDPLYGRKNKKPWEKDLRLCLHASELGFIHPRTREDMLFKTSWPKTLEHAIKDLGFKNV
jgi:23S rRNA pseudouridine1911/1915/1917 synthase